MISDEGLLYLEETLDWIRPILDLDYVYLKEENTLLIGENYIITEIGGRFKLLYGEDHPGDDTFSLDRWEEDDVAYSNSIYPLLPVFVGNIMRREMEKKIYSSIKLGDNYG